MSGLNSLQRARLAAAGVVRDQPAHAARSSTDCCNLARVLSTLDWIPASVPCSLWTFPRLVALREPLGGIVTWRGGPLWRAAGTSRVVVGISVGVGARPAGTHDVGRGHVEPSVLA